MRRFQSREYLSVLIPAILIAIGAFWLAARYVKPAPPDSFIIATSSEGTPYYQRAKKLSAPIAQNRITLEVKATDGTFDNLRQLADPNSPVQAAIIQGGVTNKEAAPNLFSLGRLMTEPVWLFYTGSEKLDKLTQLQGKRILVGPKGSATEFLAKKLLGANGVTEANSTFLNSDLFPYIEHFKQGDADAGFLVLAAEARTIQGLLRLPQVQLMNMSQAAALTQRFPFLKEITLRQGVVDFAQNIPPQDTELVATSAALVVRDDLHPALVNLLAQSILAVQSQPQLNDKGESLLFPMGSEALAIDDPEFPVAPEAKRVYKSGPTFLQRVLPFWLGNLLDRTVILALPLIGVIIPLIRIVPIAYNWRMKNRILYWYRELKNLERDLPTKAPAHVIDAKVGELKRIEEGVRKIAVPIQYSADLYNLRDHIEFVARRLEVLKSQNLSSSEGVERVPA